MIPSPIFILYSVSLLSIAACLMLIILRALLGRGEKPPSQPSDAQPPKPRFEAWAILVLIFGFVVAGYYVLRYHSLWMETDTATITLAIQSIDQQDKLLPTRYLYQHGFGYQAVSVALLYATGLSTQTLQTILYPVVGAAGVILLSFTFFREVLRSHRAAALASMLLIFDPFVLFVILRGSHEKMTWPLMMLALVMLYRSFGQPLRKMAIYVCLFYLIVFAIDTTNVFFGSVFLVAVVLSLTLGFVLFRFWRNNRPPLPRRDVQRLMYISLSGGILIFAFIAYIYPPALANLRMLKGILNQLSALLLSFEIKAQPYGYISTGWVNSQVYFMLSVFTWLVIGVSFLEWLRHGWKMIKGQVAQGLMENLDWLLYTGFAIQIAISIIVDYSGALTANVQLRLFPGFTVVAIVLIVRAMQRVLSSARLREAPRWAVPASGAVLAAWFILASILKATNEPLLSNKWTFYVPPEKAAVDWIDSHLRDAELWIGVDERLATVYNSFYLMESQSDNHYRFAKINPNMRYVFSTELDRLRAERLGVRWLPVSYWDQIYDNGQAQVDHLPLYILASP